MGIGVLLLALIASSMHGTTGKHDAVPRVFDVTQFGAKHNDSLTENDVDSLNGLAFGRAWLAACHSRGEVARLIIPQGKFEVGPAVFTGPCNSSVTVEIQGTIKRNPNVSLYHDSYWLIFERVDGVTITGTGIIDGQGKSTNEYCEKDPDTCFGRPNIQLYNSTNVLVDGVSSINPTFAHVYISHCHKITVRDMMMKAPENSIRTDGVHVSNSALVTISNNTIATGTDCVNMAHGSKDITVTELKCGPGNGISVGSFTSLSNTRTFMDTSIQNIERVLVKKCKFSRTTNGLTIRTLPGAKGSKVSAITFKDLVMDHVKNPITILQEDQKFGSRDSSVKYTFPAKISDIQFKNIKGTSTTRNLVNFTCSPRMPCEGVEIADVKLSFDGKAVGGVAAPPIPSASCLNVKVTFNGKHDGITC